MTLVMLGALAGLLGGLILGWVGGRAAGLLEGAHAERRRIRRDNRSVPVVAVRKLPAMAARGEL